MRLNMILVMGFIFINGVIGQTFEDYDETIKLDDKEISFKMIAVAGGDFLMGSPAEQNGSRSDERPIHKVGIDSLWVGQFEVTWDLYNLFLDKEISLIAKEEILEEKLDAITRPSPPFEDPSRGMGQENYPVVNISPYAALTFCKWLSTITGNFYRLPTEAEWEYSCRAGSSDAYPFGDDLSELPKYAVFFENSNGQYAKVGSKKPNKWGIYDMIGNVSEWTLDFYDASFYKNLSDKDTKNPWNVPYALHPRVYRGGSWDDNADRLRCAAREGSGLNLQRGDPQVPKSFWWYTNSEFIGFRIVRPYRQIKEKEFFEFWTKALDE